MKEASKPVPTPLTNKGVSVTATENGAWIKVKGVDFGDGGAKNFSASIADVDAGNRLVLRLDSEVGTAIGTVKVDPTGAIDKFEPQSCNVTGATGVHDLYLKFFGSATPVMRMDWWKFEP